MKSSTDTGYYWAYRKGSPVPDIIYVWKGQAVQPVIEYKTLLDGSEMEVLTLDYEPLSEGKWRVGERISPEGVDNLL